MKKVAYACILLVVMALSFVSGMLFAGSKYFKSVENTETVQENKEDKNTGKVNKKNVGVYQTDYWNGKPGILALYEDGTCQYPTGADATWTADENTVYIEIIKDSEYNRDLIVGFFFGYSFNTTDEKVSELNEHISKIDNVNSIVWDKENHTCTVTLNEPESDKKTYYEIEKIGVLSLMDYVYAEGITVSKHEAKIMESGLVLHDTYFEKVSD